MRGVVFLGERELELREFPEPTPGPGEVIVAIRASGMCGSDLHAYRAPRSQRTPDRLVIGGHEPCGIVAARGPDVADEVAPIGQRVMVHHYLGCGRCKHCRVGYSQLCLHAHQVYGGNAHGGHAPSMRVASR
ncbi:MAG: alcohol dehydrogenase catalytic domain-containing protein, partial [Chloroflexi bacterium]|nr:alcohol dehydrogenase catalytic domain-containing protein [Chloroflexota bacterium]